MTLLEVQNLHTHFITRDIGNQVQVAKALNSVSFQVDAGEILGLVGETGAGKSLTALSIMGLLRPPAEIVEGSIRFEGQDLIAMQRDELNRIRGAAIAMVGQNPRGALDPLTRIGEQIARVARAHNPGLSNDKAITMAIEAMDRVGIADAPRRALAWPHELSGGMAQRVLIAMALINGPRLLIADEPTTGLDVTVQAQILDLLRALVQELNMGAMIITHDLGVVAQYCHRTAVMYAGRIVEEGETTSVFGDPRHPYTKALIGSTPEKLDFTINAEVGGGPPNLYALQPGCHYIDRCPQAAAQCNSMPPNVALSATHHALCHFATGDQARAS
ncbi:MAG: ABC transporter ATP-binding protein [Alphaproteobacteria bacterium]|nr:ABC transporter ATP-binding protein [Alphaproteobacteria bacterium]